MTEEDLTEVCDHPPPPHNVHSTEEIPPGACMRFFYRGKCRYPECRFVHISGQAANCSSTSITHASRSSQTASWKTAPEQQATEARNLKKPSRQEACEPPLSSAGASTSSPSRSWRSVDFLLRGDSVHKHAYLKEFSAAPWLPALLEMQECKSLLSVRGKSLRKEISEAFGVFHACCRALKKLGVNPTTMSSCTTETESFESVVAACYDVTIIDLCCGKGFGSLILALSLPKAKVLAVDLNPKMDLSHFQQQANLSFKEVDITMPAAQEELRSLILQAGAKSISSGAVGTNDNAIRHVTVLVGMHLCGALSTHAARLFETMPPPAALVLVPCCLDGRQPGTKQRAKRLKVDSHLYWCLSLLFGELSVGADRKRELLVDSDVISEKNTFLIATRAR